MTPEEEINRAITCQQFLENPIIKQAFDEIKGAIHQQWLKAPVKDVELRERLWALGNAADKFEEILRSHIESGKIAKHELESKRRFGLF